jgi:hypothetical protein
MFKATTLTFSPKKAQNSINDIFMYAMHAVLMEVVMS